MAMRWVLSLLLFGSLLASVTVDANSPAPSLGANIDDDDDEMPPLNDGTIAADATQETGKDTSKDSASDTIMPTPEQLECSVCEIIAAHITQQLYVADENPKKMLQVGHRLHMNSHTGVKERKKVLYNRSETHINEIMDDLCDALLEAKPKRFASKVLMHGRWHYSTATSRDPARHDKFVRFGRERKAMRTACNRMLVYDEQLQTLLTHTTLGIPTAELELKHRICRVITPFCRDVYDGKTYGAASSADGDDDSDVNVATAGAMAVDDGERARLQAKGLIDADGKLLGGGADDDGAQKKKKKKKKKKRRTIVKSAKKNSSSSSPPATKDGGDDDITKTEL